MNAEAERVAERRVTWQQVPTCRVSDLAGYECAHCRGLDKRDDPPLMMRWF